MRPTSSRKKCWRGSPSTICRIAERREFLQAAARDNTAGGRIYDAYIAEVARAAGAGVIVTDNRRHFLAALRHGIRVETPSEFLTGLKKKRSSSS